MNTIVKFICMIFLFLFTAGTLQAATITITPTNTQSVGNCWPFGWGEDDWTPYMGFIYKNVPPFSLHPGDILAFDLGAVNDYNVQFDIAMAPTTVNGGTINAGSFTKVVSNTQNPANATGDTTIGNFELSFMVESSFNFPGGGLIIRFSNPSASYAQDDTCSPSQVQATSADASGHFVERFSSDADGVSPWDGEEQRYIGGFQIITRDTTTAVPTMTEWGMIIFMALAGLGAVYYLKRQRRA